ncbi:hypothetical protein [Micromonospora sp. NPDC005367]|uniref:hypothetical protein n=1 Tax=Micromonospora sp. NPDC005367 TaxID=3155590 RepID=UPI0033A8A1E1
MADEIVLRLDRMTAKHLADMLYDVGEHLAAGAPIAPTSTDEARRLGEVLQTLWRELGISLPYETGKAAERPRRL